MVGNPRPLNRDRTGRNAHSVLQQVLQNHSFTYAFIFPLSKQQQKLNEFEILVSINVESKHFQHS